jgi:hypothetical protein
LSGSDEETIQRTDEAVGEHDTRVDSGDKSGQRSVSRDELEDLEGSVLARKAAEIGASEPRVHANSARGYETQKPKRHRRGSVLARIAAFVVVSAAIGWSLRSRRRKRK